MSKSPRCPSFKSVESLSDFFGSRLQYVDDDLMHIQKNYGCVEWMRGHNTLKFLPGYDKTLLGSEHVLILKKRDMSWKMVYWLVEGGFEGWAKETVQEGLLFKHYFYFASQEDWSLARLAAG